MYLNTFLITFGLDPDNFINEPCDPIITDEGSILFNVRQRTDIRECPACHSKKVEIANAITVRNVDGKHFSNGPAEGLNSAVKTIIKDANGYQNFNRFRKRTLLILREAKEKK